MIGMFQHPADIAGYRARTTAAGMDADDGGQAVRLMSAGSRQSSAPPGPRDTGISPAFFSELRILRMITGLQPVLWASSVLVTRCLPRASQIKIRQCTATEHFMLSCMGTSFRRADAQM